jgi:hypothetical protein
MSELSPSALILKELVKPEKIIETHISYVMLTKDYVYKLKKAVDFGFLDFKLSTQRKIYCILEKELNERFSKGIYEEVLKIARRGKEFVLIPFHNTLVTVDYVLKMKRIDDNNFLSTKIKNSQVDEKYIFEIGKHIGTLFKSINTNYENAKENGSFDVILKNCQENFEQTEPFVGKFIDNGIYEFIKDKTLGFLEGNKELFERRLSDGYIIDGHGDLRLEHIYEDENGIGLVDCIEFNKRFRYNDVISDFGFLLMELDQTGEIGLSDACLKGFLTVYNDSDTLRLLNFYKCYRAYVRVKIACFMLNGLEEGSEKYLEELDKLKRLLDLSLTYALNMIEPKLVIYYGLMGSGKSKNSKMLNQKLPSFRVNTDEFRKEYFNIDKVEKVNEDFNKGIYSYENSLTIYKELGKLADEKLKINRMTIVDGSFSKKEYLRQFQENINIKPLKIKCEADDNTILKRLADRKDKKIATDGRPELYFKQKESFEDIGCDFLIDTTSGVEENIEKTIKFLISNEK